MPAIGMEVMGHLVISASIFEAAWSKIYQAVRLQQVDVLNYPGRKWKSRQIYVFIVRILQKKDTMNRHDSCRVFCCCCFLAFSYHGQNYLIKWF